MTRYSSIHVGTPEELARAASEGVARVEKVVDIRDLDEAIVQHTKTTTVTALAISSRFDCFDVAQILSFRGFRGQFRILPLGLPRPELMIGEARRQFPDLDIGMIQVEPAGRH
jgi:hypothetical protein